MDKVAYYRGKCLQECSREELIDIVIELGYALQESYDRHQAALETWSAIATQRRTRSKLSGH